MQKLKKVQNCVQMLLSYFPPEFRPQIGIVLGTGLGNVTTHIDVFEKIHYASLPDFPQSKVPSHAGRFILGFYQKVPLLIQQGRCHLYEGCSPAEVCMGVRIMAMLGLRALIVTNAAGALNPLFTVGDNMLITDQINLTGQSPLQGENQSVWGPRFPDMSAPYDPVFKALLSKKALDLSITLEKGVYLGLTGPELETQAETRMLRFLGADAVGMSTVLEVIAAKHCGLRVLGISCLTNKNIPHCMAETTLEEIVAQAEKGGETLDRLLRAVLPEMSALLDSPDSDS